MRLVSLRRNLLVLTDLHSRAESLFDFSQILGKLKHLSVGVLTVNRIPGRREVTFGDKWQQIIETVNSDLESSVTTGFSEVSESQKQRGQSRISLRLLYAITARGAINSKQSEVNRYSPQGAGEEDKYWPCPAGP